MRAFERILAVSDIHGEKQLLLKLLQSAQYEPEFDLLVVCGDLMDRGQENIATFATCVDLQKKGAILLKGNHEQFLERSLLEMINSEVWRSHPSEELHNWVQHYGGAETYKEIKDLSNAKLLELLTIVQKLPCYINVKNYIFSHAGANVRKPIEENSEKELVWMEDSFPWCPAYKDKIIIFGHIPTWLLYQAQKKENIKQRSKNAKIWYDANNKDKIGIDCGSVFGGRLAMLELPSYREFYT